MVYIGGSVGRESTEDSTWVHVVVKKNGGSQCVCGTLRKFCMVSMVKILNFYSKILTINLDR